MQLYTLKNSPNCRKILATIALLKLEPKVTVCEMSLEGLGKDEFLQMNPNSLVPTLVEGDYILWESNAIMIYLASQVDNHIIYPNNPQIRGDIHRWQFWECNHYNKAINAIIWETFAKPLFNLPGDPDENVIEAALPDFHRYAKVLEQTLHDRAFITGEHITLADISIGYLSPIVLMESARIPLHAYPAVERWYRRLEDNQAWAKYKPDF